MKNLFEKFPAIPKIAGWIVIFLIFEEIIFRKITFAGMFNRPMAIIWCIATLILAVILSCIVNAYKKSKVLDTIIYLFGCLLINIEKRFS